MVGIHFKYNFWLLLWSFHNTLLTAVSTTSAGYGVCLLYKNQMVFKPAENETWDAI